MSEMSFRPIGFDSGDPMPRRHTKDGDDVSPPLEWTNAPQDAESFVVICDDPDATEGTFTHWAIYDIPGNQRNLDEGLPKSADLPNGAKQGLNDFGAIGWGGPRPPRGDGPHTYCLQLYALDSKLNLPAGVRRKQIHDAMRGRVLATSEITCTYTRETENV